LGVAGVVLIGASSKLQMAERTRGVLWIPNASLPGENPNEMIGKRQDSNP